MILCLECRKLWPKGTTYCGCCGGSLAKRYCPQGHESPLHVRACLSCGSTKLSKGARAFNVRLITLGVLVLLLFVVKALNPITLHDVQQFIRLVLFAVVVPLVSLYVASVVLGSFLGERIQKVISSFWKWLFHSVGKLLSWAWRCFKSYKTKKP